MMVAVAHKPIGGPRGLPWSNHITLKSPAGNIAAVLPSEFWSAGMKLRG
ncbi:MAG: hypothetical protein WBF03_05730 [Xanthobacteraceae bacterium]|jgi:hypothetical protein